MHFDPKAMSGPLYCCIPPAPPAPPAMKAGVAVASGTRSSAFHGDARAKRRVPGAERAQRGVPPSPGRTEGTARSPWATPPRLAHTAGSRGHSLPAKALGSAAERARPRRLHRSPGLLSIRRFFFQCFGDTEGNVAAPLQRL